VRDENDEPTTAAFIIRDKQGRVYPSQAKRLAPDFAFHPQVYRGDGETLHLPDGTYNVEFSRGPRIAGPDAQPYRRGQAAKRGVQGSALDRPEQNSATGRATITSTPPVARTT